MLAFLFYSDVIYVVRGSSYLLNFLPKAHVHNLGFIEQQVPSGAPRE